MESGFALLGEQVVSAREVMCVTEMRGQKQGVSLIRDRNRLESSLLVHVCSHSLECSYSHCLAYMASVPH